MPQTNAERRQKYREKSPEKFAEIHKNNVYNFRAKNPEKSKEIQARSRAKHREKRKLESSDRYHNKEGWLKSKCRRFGLTQEQYWEMLASQGNGCAVCSRPESFVDPKSGRTRRLAIDHCHTSGRVRGILCSRCNLTLGLFEDNPDTIRRLAEYAAKGAT
jgi:hypothetical protein